MSTELKKPLVIKIKKLDINQAYFFGTAEIDGIEYKINIQGHWKEKLIKLPIKHHKRIEYSSDYQAKMYQLRK